MNFIDRFRAQSTRIKELEEQLDAADLAIEIHKANMTITRISMAKMINDIVTDLESGDISNIDIVALKTLSTRLIQMCEEK